MNNVIKLLVVLLTGCATTTKETQRLDAVPELAGPRTNGVYRVFVGSSSCRPQSGINPMVWCPNEEPIAGRPVRVEWTTKAMPPHPADVAVLVSSWRPASGVFDFTLFGASGCQLLVNMDQLVYIPSSYHDSKLSRQLGSGRIQFEWMPDNSFIGKSLFMQLLVLAPGENFAGIVASPALEIFVGSSG